MTELRRHSWCNYKAQKDKSEEQLYLERVECGPCASACKKKIVQERWRRENVRVRKEYLDGQKALWSVLLESLGLGAEKKTGKEHGAEKQQKAGKKDQGDGGELSGLFDIIAESQKGLPGEPKGPAVIVDLIHESTFERKLEKAREEARKREREIQQSMSVLGKEPRNENRGSKVVIRGGISERTAIAQAQQGNFVKNLGGGGRLQSKGDNSRGSSKAKQASRGGSKAKQARVSATVNTKF